MTIPKLDDNYLEMLEAEERSRGHAIGRVALEFISDSPNRYEILQAFGRALRALDDAGSDYSRNLLAMFDSHGASPAKARAFISAVVEEYDFGD